MATRDWDCDCIEFDDKGRIVIRDPGLSRQVVALLKKVGQVTLVAPPKPGPPGPNMCDCTFTNRQQTILPEFESKAPEKGVK